MGGDFTLVAAGKSQVFHTHLCVIKVLENDALIRGTYWEYAIGDPSEQPVISMTNSGLQTCMYNSRSVLITYWPCDTTTGTIAYIAYTYPPVPYNIITYHEEPTPPAS